MYTQNPVNTDIGIYSIPTGPDTNLNKYIGINHEADTKSVINTVRQFLNISISCFLSV